MLETWKGSRLSAGAQLEISLSCLLLSACLVCLYPGVGVSRALSQLSCPSITISCLRLGLSEDPERLRVFLYIYLLCTVGLAQLQLTVGGQRRVWGVPFQQLSFSCGVWLPSLQRPVVLQRGYSQFSLPQVTRLCVPWGGGVSLLALLLCP